MSSIREISPPSQTSPALSEGYDGSVSMPGSYFPGTRIIYPDALVEAHNALSHRMEQLESTQREVVTLLRQIADQGALQRSANPNDNLPDELTGEHATPGDPARQTFSSSVEARQATGRRRRSRDTPPRARRTLFSTPLTAPARLSMPSTGRREARHRDTSSEGFGHQQDHVQWSPYVTMADLQTLLQNEKNVLMQEAAPEPPYAQSIALLPYPPGYLTPKFSKFDGRKGNPREHVVRFIEALGPFGNDHTLRLREFSKTLTDRAYKWYANLESGSLTTWSQLATIFQSKFFQAEERVTTLSLTKEVQGPGEDLLSYVHRFHDRAMECYETHEEEALAKICIQGMQGSYRIHLINLKLLTFADLIEAFRNLASNLAICAQGAAQEKYRGKRRPQVSAADEPPGKKNARPSRAPRAKNPDEAPPPFPCTPEEVETVIKKWIQHGDIRLPEVAHEPTTEEMAHPKYCMYHRHTRHLTYDCWALRNTFHRRIANGELILPPRDVREEPFPAHDRGVAMMVSDMETEMEGTKGGAAEIALVQGDDLEAFHLLEVAPVENILQKMDFSPFAQKEIAKFLWLAAKEGVKEVASIASLPVSQRSTGSALVFTEEDKCAPTPHNRPLYITSSLNGVELKRAFLDNGSSFNIMPLEVFRRSGLLDEKLIRRPIEIARFGSDIRITEGHVTAELAIGKFKSSVKFHVIDLDTSYHLLMGQSWIHKFGIVLSSYHQCMKGFWNGKQVMVRCSDRLFTKRESHMVEVGFFNKLEDAEEPQPLRAFPLPKWEDVDQQKEEKMPGAATSRRKPAVCKRICLADGRVAYRL
ncbi:uncharacterized protein LOC132314449 [Cornus florida]|uniref:uncharacterized protein LOC132314449 n=1 Tax=Cornus florida TaxID=4283 RepID=UPI00289ADF42|nr:uncharacterized protein LOC132314449 [Cornus florida]